MALLMRAELAAPGLQFLSNEQYNQLFTMHGTIMLLLFATPIVFGFANYCAAAADRRAGRGVPAAERVLATGCSCSAALIVVAGFLTPGGAADFGWTAYAPLTDADALARRRRATCGSWAWSSPAWAPSWARVNIITTWSACARPGMTMFRMPIFTWNILVTVDPGPARVPGPHRGAVRAGRRPAPRRARLRPGQRRRDPVAAPVLVLRPPRGLHRGAAVLRHRHRDHPGVLAASRCSATTGWSSRRSSIAALSIAVWAHHMFATGAVLLPFFSFMSFLIAVPTGIKFFNWIGTMWRGQLTFETPMLFSIGFLVTFLLGGLTGVLLACPPLDFHVTDTYFVVAHFHYVLFGTIVFATFAGIYFWFPKMTGRLLDERLGKLHFWLTFIGFHTTFLVQHWLGDEGMPRRYADYLPTDGFTTAQHRLDHRARSSSARRCCRSSGTSSRAAATARSSPSTTRGATATRWSGRPPARRRGTTSPSCPGSAPSARRSNCTTRTWSSGCAPRPTSAGAPS